MESWISFYPIISLFTAIGKSLLTRIKRESHKQIKLRSFRYYTVDLSEKELSRYELQKVSFNKKRELFKNKSTESINKPKDLRKALKSLGLPNKVSSCEVKALNTVEHNINSVLKEFKSYYSTLAEDFVKLLSKPTNKCSINTVC